MMGDDYAGYDESKGDPNIKPKPAPPPRLHKAEETSLTITFPPQEQFISKIKAQAMPIVLIKDPQNPFSSFGPPGGVSVDVTNPDGDIKSATTCIFKGLRPGTRYITRLICTNPAGTTAGRISGKYLTGPMKPEAPTFLHAKPNSIFIKFQDQGRQGCQEVSKLTIGVARAGQADPFAKENKPGEMSDSSPKCSELKQARIQKLHPGSLYVFRLVVHNASGSAVGAVSQPMLTMPGVPSRLREDSTKRTSSSVTVKFQPHGQHLTKLEIQYTKLAGTKRTFEMLMKDGGKSVSIDDPRQANNFTIKGLQGNSKYVFRLVATNASGSTVGNVLGPITTVEFAPEMLDKSGWMYEVPPQQPKKGLARRLSSRGKTQPKKYWYVIDGRLLNWFTDTDTKEEVGFLHLSKLKRITYLPDADKQARQFALILKNGTKMTLECESTDPNIRTHEYTLSWMKAIQNALTAQNQPQEAKKEGRRASIQPAAEDELEELLEEEEEEEDEFGDEDWDDGFGGDDDENGGFGGFDEEEGGFGDDDFAGDGFGDAGDDEEGEIFGEDFDGGDEFGGFDEEEEGF